MGSGPRKRRAHRRSRRRARTLCAACLLALLATFAFAPSALAQLRKVNIAFTCKTITYEFLGFPAGKQDTVTLKARSQGVILLEEKFTFTGPDGKVTVNINLPAGHQLIKAGALWNTNGAVGESGKHAERLVCTAPVAALTVQKLQEIAGSGKAFSAAPLTGQTGQVVEYKMVVSNTGNVPLVLTDFSDPNCEAGTLAGGQGEAPLALGAQTVYTCSRKLGESGVYKNVASATADPAEGGNPVTAESNPVEVTVAAKPQWETLKLQEIVGSKAGFTSSALTATIGQTVAYEIIVKNTGNVPVLVDEFADIYCDAGTISGQVPTTIAVGSSTTYGCTHKLKEETTVENVAIVTATPVGSPKATEPTNTVKVKVNAAAPTGTTPPPGSGSTTGTSGTSGTTTTKTSPGSGVLASKNKHKKKKAKPHTRAHRTPRFTG